jgi:osmotically-inducible protein OsmY
VGLDRDETADTTIAEESRAALAGSKLVPAGSVKVEVSDGWVTLSGQVRNHFQRQAAKHAVRGIKGERGIVDHIAISGSPVSGDVADRVNKALARDALLQGSSLVASNTGSTIYLDGTAKSYAAEQRAREIAWSAPGVADVVDRSKVVP